MRLKFGENVETPLNTHGTVIEFDTEGRDVKVVYKDGSTQWFYSTDLKQV